MDFVSEKGAVRMVSTYVEHEMPEYRRVTEKELNAGESLRKQEQLLTESHIMVHRQLILKIVRCLDKQPPGSVEQIQAVF